MSNTLVIWYSLEGNTESAVSALRKVMEFDDARLVPEKEPPKSGAKKFLVGGGSVIRKEKPRLAPVGADADAYERVILAFPVWAGCYPPAIRTYLAENALRNKEIAVIACSASGNADKVFARLSKELCGPESGNRLIGTLSLRDPLKNPEEAEKKLAEFAAAL